MPDKLCGLTLSSFSPLSHNGLHMFAKSLGRRFEKPQALSHFFIYMKQTWALVLCDT